MSSGVRAIIAVAAGLMLSGCSGERDAASTGDGEDTGATEVEAPHVDAVLASLAVEQGPRRADPKPDDDSPRGCPRENWPGPWTACAEADWVRRVVESGGYRVVGETGSALVAEGKGQSFYAWTTPAARHPAAMPGEAGNWRRLAIVRGVAVHGDDLWRFWEAQGFVFWVKAGPTQDSIVPSPAALARLIEASRRLSPAVE